MKKIIAWIILGGWVIVFGILFWASLVEMFRTLAGYSLQDWAKGFLIGLAITAGVLSIVWAANEVER